MRKVNKRLLKANTLVEVIFVILLSAIIIGAIFSELLFNKSFAVNFFSKEQKLSEITSFVNNMEHEWYNASKITKEENQIRLFMHNGDIVDYKLHEDLVLRQFNESTDSLKLDYFEYTIDSIEDAYLSIVFMDIRLCIDKDIIPFLLVHKYNKGDLYVNN